MAFCRKCGKELEDPEKPCSACGTKVRHIYLSDAMLSVKKKTAQIAPIAIKTVQGFDFKSKIINALNDLQSAKKMFLIMLGSILLNFVLMFFDMIKVDLFVIKINGSAIKVMNELKDFSYSYGGTTVKAGGDSEILIPMLTISIILTLASLILSVLPVILGKNSIERFS